MNHSLLALLAGALFGAGLILSGMANPDIVLAFLDLSGNWDPTLAFVMAGGLVVALPAFHGAKRRAQPWLDTKFHLPTSKDVDQRLLAGSALFGVGWGIAGYCPGPGLVALGFGVLEPWLFVAALITGSQVTRKLLR